MAASRSEEMSSHTKEVLLTRHTNWHKIVCLAPKKLWNDGVVFASIQQDYSARSKRQAPVLAEIPLDGLSITIVAQAIVLRDAVKRTAPSS